MISSESSPMHYQPSSTFELHQATFQQNNCTSSSFPVTLWPWVNIKAVRAMEKIIIEEINEQMTYGGNKRTFEPLRYIVSLIHRLNISVSLDMANKVTTAAVVEVVVVVFVVVVILLLPLLLPFLPLLFPVLFVPPPSAASSDSSLSPPLHPLTVNSGPQAINLFLLVPPSAYKPVKILLGLFFYFLCAAIYHFHYSELNAFVLPTTWFLLNRNGRDTAVHYSSLQLLQSLFPPISSMPRRRHFRQGKTARSQCCNNPPAHLSAVKLTHTANTHCPHCRWPGQYSVQAILYRGEAPCTAEATATTATGCLHCLQSSFCKGVTCFFCPRKTHSLQYWSIEDRMTFLYTPNMCTLVKTCITRQRWQVTLCHVHGISLAFFKSAVYQAQSVLGRIKPS